MLFTSKLLLTTYFLIVFHLSCFAYELDLSNDDEWLLDLYLNPPVTPVSKVHLFNLTNPKGFLEGNEPPVFDDVGPYTYTEKWVRDNPNWISDSEVEFVPKKIYRFSPQLSKGNRQTDIITSVNVPMLALLHQMRYGPQILDKAVNSLLNILDQKATQDHVVREYLWGEKSDLVKLGRDIAYGQANRYPYEQFGLYIGKNNTDNGKLRVNTGLSGAGTLGRIVAFRGKQQYGKWEAGSECDKVRGTDGLVYKSGLSKADRIYLKNPGFFCRAFPFEFAKEVEQFGIRGYRFVMSKDVYSSPQDFEGNRCFCVDGSCKGSFNQFSGMLNATACLHGAPLSTSHPHFLYADEGLTANIVGMKPDPRLHESYIDIEPTTGVPLKVRIGIQVNALMEPVVGVERAKGFREMPIPLTYTMIEGVGLSEPQHLDRLKTIIAKRNNK